MKIIKHFIFALLLFPLFSTTTFSEVFSEEQNLFQQNLLEITTDISDHIYHIVLATNHQGQLIHGQVDNEIIPAEKFVQQIQNGMVLSKSGNTPVVSLVGEDFQPDSGGEVRLRYMTRPFPKAYRSIKFHLEKNEAWELYLENDDGEKIVVKKLHVLTRKFFGIPIGISRIKINP